MAVSCCIIGCPTIVRANHANRLFTFPPKSSSEYKQWLSACSESAIHIKKLKNPRICPIHFRNSIKGISYPKDTPSLFLTKNEIQFIKTQWASINQPVVEWLILTHRLHPEMNVNGAMLKAKATEVANILKITKFDVDFGWLHNFEVYLNLNGIQHLWKGKQASKSLTAEELQLTGDSNVQSVAHVDDLKAEQTIHTYSEAIDRVKLLEDYAKRIHNDRAIELLKHMQEILKSRI